ncbi:hypothetical protein XU18_1164 [Perkinsela sp. CCAP 1560/4]|nr:hypothetical protein XU18_1164 [Perkinsela sp. CCAP 1560/4]|eukprot:KNH08309.1 hypothetical protein XU18_1164 [Perkinsela sp. CCAP 1560/4]
MSTSCLRQFFRSRKNLQPQFLSAPTNVTIRQSLSYASVGKSKPQGKSPAKKDKRAVNKPEYRELIDSTQTPDASSSDLPAHQDINSAFSTPVSMDSPASSANNIQDIDISTQRKILSIQGFTPFHEFPEELLNRLFKNCPLNIRLLPFQQQGVGWMVRKELTSNGGILADHLGLGKTIQMIALILLNPLKIMKTDRLFVDEIIENAGSMCISQLQRMATVCRLLYKLPGIGDCSRLLQPETNLFELAIQIEDRLQELVGCNSAQEQLVIQQCQARLEPWLLYTKRFYANYENKCRMFINSSKGDINLHDLKEKHTFETNELRTLIIVPTSILHQWRDELHRHISKDHPFTLFVYHPQGEGRVPAEALELYDFVITTYDIVLRDALPYLRSLEAVENSSSTDHKGSVTKEIRERMEKDKQARGDMVADRKKCGPLFTVVWKRVVLDEAHVVRNPWTKRWKAVSQLIAMKKWCITATPMQNDLTDMQNLLHFVQSPPLPLPSRFDSHILLKDKDLQEAVARSLRDVVLRREPVMTRCVPLPNERSASGEPILVKRRVALLDLPPKIERIELIASSDSEVELYNGLITRTRRLTGAMGEGTKGHTFFYLTLLCRLRQACCHPWLVENVNLAEGQVFCEECKNLAEHPVELTCGHAMCYPCLANTFEEADERLGDSLPCDSMDEPPTVPYSARAMLQLDQGAGKENDDYHEFGRVVRIKCPQDQCEGFVRRSALRRYQKHREIRVKYRERPFVSSSKIDTCLAILRKIKKKFPSDKTVVFTHFVSFMNILEIALENAKMRFLRLDGTMKSNERAGVVSAFQRDEGIPVLLASKVACGVGLNLTMANHCIVLDPWWNPGIEEQAVHRCHRIGQTKAVHIYRCLTDKSIEYMCWQIANKKKVVGDMVIQSTMEGGESSFPVEQAVMLQESIRSEELKKKEMKLKEKRKSTAKASDKSQGAKVSTVQSLLIQSIGLRTE